MNKLEEGTTVASGIALGSYNVSITFDTVNKNFTITDEHGYVYAFNEKELGTPYFFHAQDYGGPFTRDVHLRQAHFASNNWNVHDIEGDMISWKISKITDPFGKEIVFEYTRSLITTFPSITDQKAYGTNNTNATNPGSIPLVYNLGSGVEHTVRIYTQEVANLNRISGDFGEITFNLGSRKDLFSAQQYENWAEGNFLFKWMPNTQDSPYKIDGITVKNYRNETIKTVSFDYSYFNSQHENQLGQQEYLRLKLDGVMINDQIHAFSYLNVNNLPSKATPDIDFWGFYNGAGNANTLPDFGRYSINLAFCAGGCPIEAYYQYRPTDTRKSNFNFGKNGLLQSITYPTGGKTEFTFEANQAALELPQYYSPYIYDGDKLGSAGLRNSKDYNWSYQYLKMANDPTYTYVDYMDTCQTTVSDYGQGQDFTITTTDACDRDYNIRIKSTIACATGCQLNVSPTGPATWIRNTDTNQVTNVFYFDHHATPGSNWYVCLIEELLLPVGNYRFEYNPSYQQVVNGTTYIASNNSNLKVYEGTNPGASQQTTYEQFEIGGARIKEIVEKDTDGTILTKKRLSYSETKSNGQVLSSGLLMDELVFHSKNKGYFEYTPEHYYNNTINIHSNNVLRGKNSAAGSHIGYSKVKEEYVDANDQLVNGYTVSTFTNEPNSYTTRDIGNVPIGIGLDPFDPSDDSSTIVSYEEVYILNAPPKTNSYKNGSLLKTETFSVTNALISETTHEYIERAKGSYIPGGFPYPLISYQFFLLECGGAAGTGLCGYFPYIPYYHTISMNDVTENKLWLPSHSQNTVYLDGEAFITHRNFEYSPFHPSPILVEETGEAGDLIRTYYNYPQDLDTNYATDLINEHRFSQLLSSNAERVHDNTATTLSNSIMEFGSHSSLLISMPTLYNASQKGSSDELYYRYGKYDPRGNVLELTREDGITVSFIYNNHDLMLARVENASYAEIEALSGFGANFDIADTLTPTQINNLRTLGKAYVTTYTYKPSVGITSMTDPRGYTMYYEYDNENRLEYVKDADGRVYSENEYHYRNQN